MNRVALALSGNHKKPSYVNALEPYFIVERILPGDPRGAAEFDGLVLAGGADVNPALYGETRHAETEDSDDERDATEKRLIEEALEADLPILAICRGMQMLNVALGGGLIQHLPTAAIHRQKGVADAHQVRIEPGSRLAVIVGREEISVNSRHHQAVAPERLGRGLKITARRPEDQVVEALEMPSRDFVIAVQWHPEDRVSTHESDRALFRAFADAVSRRSSAALPSAPELTRT